MDDYKATGVVFIKETLKKSGAETEARLLALLTPEELSSYTRVLPISWYPISTIMSLYEKAAPIMYPADKDPLWQLGRQAALDHLRGVYKILVSMTTPAFVIKQSGKLWRTYFKKGTAWVTETGIKNRIHYNIKDFPELPANFRHHLCGYIAGTMEVANAKNIRVAEDSETTPELWKWVVEWD